MSLNFNANLVNDMSKYMGHNILGYEAKSPEDNLKRFNTTMTDIVSNQNASPIAYITDVQPPNRIKMDTIHDNTPTLEEKKENFRMKELLDKQIYFSKEVATIIIAMIIFFMIYSIAYIYISQKKLEFMINFMYNKEKNENV